MGRQTDRQKHGRGSKEISDLQGKVWDASYGSQRKMGDFIAHACSQTAGQLAGREF